MVVVLRVGVRGRDWEGVMRPSAADKTLFPGHGAAS